VTVKTSPGDYVPFDQMRMFRYSGGRWNAFGAVASVKP
jgi:hypothetical protein